jgi:hypothetical protein
MKAWEALQILESLSPDTEVTLTIGRNRQTVKLPRLPKFNDYPYPTPQWVIDYETKRIGYDTITCH